MMDSIAPVPQKSKHNLSTEEKTALKQMTEDEEIIIRTDHKGGCLVIMNKYFHRDKLVILEHLSTDTYVEKDIN